MEQNSFLKIIGLRNVKTSEVKPKYFPFDGFFDGQLVVVQAIEDIKNLNSNGSFGLYGIFDNNQFTNAKTIQNRMLKKKKNWQEMKLVPFDFPNINKEIDSNEESCMDKDEELETSYNLCEITRFNDNENVVIPTTDNNIENGAANWKKLKERDPEMLNKLLTLSGNQVTFPYYLTLEEAFFLCYTLESLNIWDENQFLLSEHECWKRFNKAKKNFPFYYAAYHYYRYNGWVVKPGDLYGGDFVLYKSSPEKYHSFYVVMVSINKENYDLLSSWQSWFTTLRALEGVNKTLILSTVNGPVYKEGDPIDLTQYMVKDTIIKRWVPNQNRSKPCKSEPSTSNK